MNQNKDTYLLGLFSELNQHIRNTETKYITISISYLSLVSIICSILLKIETKNVLNTLTYNHIIVYSLIIIIGCFVIVMQKWYRVWKEHYLQRCQEIDSEFKVEAKFKPFWLIPNKKNPIVNVDKSLFYFTNIVNLLIVFKLCYDLYSSSNYTFLKFILPIIIIVFYILFLIIIKLNISVNKSLTA